jgi:hypothetical protein
VVTVLLYVVWLYRAYNLCGNYGSRGGPTQERWRQSPWFLLLIKGSSEFLLLNGGSVDRVFVFVFGLN